jgi:hypothetical protein
MYGADSLSDLPAEGMIDAPLGEDMSDPVDVLLAMTEDPSKGKARTLDFVRVKFKDLKADNKRLRDRVTDLEQTLSIVQTAQEWTMGKGMTQEQADKMREIRGLLEQAKQARVEMQNFSTNSKAALYEKLRSAKIALKKEREDKREMKERLLHAFDRARIIKEHHAQMTEQAEDERKSWQATVDSLKNRHKRELMRLQGEGAVMQADRQEQLSYFGEQVVEDLAQLQMHLREVRAKTVDNIMLEQDPDLEDLPPDDYDLEGYGEAER